MNVALAQINTTVGDLAGNDVSWLVRKHRAKIGRNYTPNPLADQLCEMGRFGQKTSCLSWISRNLPNLKTKHSSMWPGSRPCSRTR